MDDIEIEKLTPDWLVEAIIEAARDGDDEDTIYYARRLQRLRDGVTAGQKGPE